jgi:cyclic pyranopterin phosphate synthase
MPARGAFFRGGVAIMAGMPPSPSQPAGSTDGAPAGGAVPAHPLRMIDVGHKPVSLRTACASARLRAAPETIRRLLERRLEKGDALVAARLAGIMAAKRTSDVIPLCHPLPLDAVEVSLSPDGPDAIAIVTTVRATARTGVEMEALLAATAAALTIYDMCKSIDRDMSIEHVRLDAKTGGTRGDYTRG